jgi:hypothetical protein
MSVLIFGLNVVEAVEAEHAAHDACGAPPCRHWSVRPVPFWPENTERLNASRSMCSTLHQLVVDWRTRPWRPTSRFCTTRRPPPWLCPGTPSARGTALPRWKNPVRAARSPSGRRRPSARAPCCSRRARTGSTGSPRRGWTLPAPFLPIIPTSPSRKSSARLGVLLVVLEAELRWRIMGVVGFSKLLQKCGFLINSASPHLCGEKLPRSQSGLNPTKSNYPANVPSPGIAANCYLCSTLYAPLPASGQFFTKSIHLHAFPLAPVICSAPVFPCLHPPRNTST